MRKEYDWYRFDSNSDKTSYDVTNELQIFSISNKNIEYADITRANGNQNSICKMTYKPTNKKRHYRLSPKMMVKYKEIHWRLTCEGKNNSSSVRGEKDRLLRHYITIYSVWGKKENISDQYKRFSVLQQSCTIKIINVYDTGRSYNMDFEWGVDSDCLH
jgi:hypothetical protein